MTCWRCLRDWQETGVWQQLNELLLGELKSAGASEAADGSTSITPRSWTGAAASWRKWFRRGSLPCGRPPGALACIDR